MHTPHWQRCLFLTLALLALGCLITRPVSAQDLYVGSNSSGVSSNLPAGTNSFGNTFIGYSTDLTNTPANSNQLTVDGTVATTLVNSSGLTVGASGDSNVLLISNGGIVANADGYIGSNGSSNAVVVTGVGSAWTNSGDLSIGESGGSGNSLVISNGATVVNGLSLLGSVIGNDVTSSNNTVLVTGSNSTWNNEADLSIGYDGSGNSLVVSNGGAVNTGFVVPSTGYIGKNATSSNNSVLVTGTNSAWSNAFGFFVGYSGSSNSLTVSNGGSVYAGSLNGVVVGNDTTSSNNSLLVSGSNSTIISTGGLTVGSSGSGNTLTIESNAVVSNSSDVVLGLQATSSNNSVVVNGASWTNTGALKVGFDGSSNSLTATNGSTLVVAGDLSIGNQADSFSNSMLLSDSNTVASVVGTLYVGNEGNNNSLVISNGAKLNSSNDAYIGAFLTSSSNTLTVVGATWSNTGNIYLGDGVATGTGNALNIGQGGSVSAQGITIGFNTVSNAINVGTLGGSDTNVSLSAQTIDLGNQGVINFNQADQTTLAANISDNGSVNQLGTGATILSGSNTYTGTTIVEGGALAITGSIVNANGAVVVGGSNSGTSMIASNGGIVDVSYLYLGSNATSSNNTLLVTGSNSAWTNNADLYVGYLGSGNKMVLSNGGTMLLGINCLLGGVVGYDAASSNNSVVVTGSNSTWNMEYDLYVGYSGSGNSMVISNGGTVVTGYQIPSAGYIGSQSTSSNNSVTVTGANSSWNSVNGIYVGDQGSSNSLLVINGGSVNAGALYGVTIGNATTSSNNSVLVSGSNSTIVSTGGVTVGSSGSGNTLTIESNAVVSNSSDVVLGLQATSSNNSVVVNGASWTNTGALKVGFDGSSNSLTATNGSTLVVAGDLSIGNQADSFSNSMLLSDSNTVASVVGTLYVGNEGNNNSLVISNGAKLNSSNDAYIGAFLTSSSNTVTVVGATWSNVGNIYLGDSNATGTGNTLNVGQNGRVSAQGISFSPNGISNVINIGTYAGSDTNVSLQVNTIDLGSNGNINFNQADQNTFAANISGAGTLSQLGVGTTVLSGTNSYTGLTAISNGALLINGINSGVGIITVATNSTLGGSGSATNSAVTVAGGGNITPGNGSAPGTLSIGSLTINSGGNLNIFLSGGVSSVLDVKGSVAIDGNLNFTSLSTLTNGLYTFLTSTGTISGAFSSTNNLPTGYQLFYGSNSIYIQQVAGLTLGDSTNSIITGGTTNITVPITNSAYTGGAPLVFTGTSGTNLTGSIGSTTLSASSSTNVGGLTYTSTNIGTNTGSYTITAPAASPTSSNGTVTLLVYDHSSGSLSSNPVAISAIVGYSNAVTTNVGVSNAAGFRVDLAAGSASNGGVIFTGANNIAAGSSSNATVSLATGQGTGTFTNSLSISYRDSSVLAGASTNTGTDTLTVTTAVYDHASGSLSTNAVALSNVIVGYSNAVTTNVGVSNAAGFRVDLAAGGTNGTVSFSGTTNIAAGSSSNATVSLATGQGTGTFTNKVAIVYSDASNLAGASTNLGSSTLTVRGAVYDHAAGSLSNSVMLTAHVGYTNTATANLAISNAAGFRVALGLGDATSSNNVSFTGVTNVAAGSSSNGVLSLGTGIGVGAFTNTIAVTFADSSALSGASTNVGSTNIIVHGLVYTGQATWTNNGTGNWTSFANWDVPGGTPGLDGSLSTNDTATFGSAGSGTVTLNTNASLMALNFSNATSSYTVTGLGTLSLAAGSNQPSITVSAGRSNSIINQVNLTTNTTLDIATNTRLSLGGAVSGSGGVTLTNSGTLLLSHSNSFAGGTTLQAGTIASFNPNALGSGSVALNGGTLQLYNSLTVNSLIWSTNSIISIASAGSSLTATNSVDLGSTNSPHLFNILSLPTTEQVQLFAFGTNNFTASEFGFYGPGISTNGYALSVSNNVLYLNALSLIAYDYTTTISGTGTYPSVTFRTNGILNITPTGNLTITGAVAVTNTGTLMDNGVLSTPVVTVQQGSTLAGTGVIKAISGSVNVTNSGVVNPGSSNNPTGTLTINGNYTQTGTGTFVLNTASSTQNNKLQVNGSATLGGSIQVNGIQGHVIQYGDKYAFLSSTGPISGSFSSIEVPTGYRGRLIVEGDPVASILIAPLSYTQMAANQNQLAVASALNSFINATSGDQLTVATALDSLTASEYGQAFNAIMPNLYQSLSTITFNLANAQNSELIQRLWGVRVAGTGFSMNGFADNTPVVEGQGDGDKNPKDAKDILRPGPGNHWGMFADANGIFATANSGNMLPNYNSQSGGITTGLTYKWNDSFGTGIYAGYEGSYVNYGGGSSLIDNSVRFGVFGTYGQPDGKGFFADGLIGGGYNNYSVTRAISFTGLNRTANSSPGAGELDSMLASGYDLKQGNWTYGPLTSLQYTYFAATPVNETGAQSLDFNSSSWDTSSLIYSLGAHAAYNWQANKDILVIPQISLSWQHEFLQNAYNINGSLGGSPGFANTSAAPQRDSLYTGIGVTIEFYKKWMTSLFYNASAGNQNQTSQNVFWSAGMKF
jgi:T5SS/PEP-CTERM-associated repeat protein